MSFSTRKWNNFLYEELLIESRLKAAVKKFPEIDQEIIKQLSLSDPSGKNAYLMWMTQAMKDSGAGVYDVPGLARERIFDIVPIVTDFHKAKQRINQLNKNRKQAGKSLYPNDINQFKSLDELEGFIDNLGLSSSEEKKKKKEAALGGANIMQDDEDFFVIRPLTQEASCFFGRKTKWCISAERSQNYYDSYTRQGKSFYFVLNKNLPENSMFKKVALVFDKSGQFEEWFDAPDNGYSSEYELGNVLLFNILAPAIKGMGMAVEDSDVDNIADVFRNGSQLEEYLGEDVDEDDRGPEQRINRKVYKGIVDYLKKHGNDLPVDVNEIPELGSTTLYDNDMAAEVFSGIADQTWGQMYADAQSDTEDNPAGAFDYDELHEAEQNAGLQHIEVYYDEYDAGEWTWNAHINISMDNSPFDLLQYTNFDFDEDEPESDENFKYGDYDDVFGGYSSDEDDIMETIQSAFDSAGIYIDRVERLDMGEFRLEMEPDYSESPQSGLEGFVEFLERLKRYDKNFPEAEEQAYTDLQDNDLAIDPASRLDDKQSWVQMLKTMKHLAYDVKSGKMDVFGKAIFEIPNMIRNFKEMQKFFPALPDGQVVGMSLPDEYKEIYRKQEEMVRQLQYHLNAEMKTKAFTNGLIRHLEAEMLKAQPEQYKDQLRQIGLPGIKKDRKPSEEVFPDHLFFTQDFVFAPRLELLNNIQQGQKDSGELSIGDREIKGAHGIGVMGFFNMDLKFLKRIAESDPQQFASYINGFKWLDENWQEAQNMIGQYISDNLVQTAKKLKGISGLKDLERDDLAKSSRKARPKSGLAEMGCGPRPKRKFKVKLKRR
jgi:hypothetical protein